MRDCACWGGAAQPPVSIGASLDPDEWLIFHHSIRMVDYIQYTQGGVLSPDGKCKPFDSHADGYVSLCFRNPPPQTNIRQPHTSFSRGEGAVVIVLKPLDNAIRDNDRIYASVRHAVQDLVDLPLIES
jgi:hypothetical protein